MNDTSRDELRETIAGNIGNYGYQCINTESGYHESPDEEPIATEIIEAVTAARDAEIREALESEGLVAMFARMMWTQDDKPTATPSSSYYMAARYNLDTIVKHIGLGDSDTGVQG